MKKQSCEAELCTCVPSAKWSQVRQNTDPLTLRSVRRSSVHSPLDISNLVCEPPRVNRYYAFLYELLKEEWDRNDLITCCNYAVSLLLPQCLHFVSRFLCPTEHFSFNSFLSISSLYFLSFYDSGFWIVFCDPYQCHREHRKT